MRNKMIEKFIEEMKTWPIEEIVRVAKVLNIKDAEESAKEDIYTLVEEVAKARVKNKFKQYSMSF